MWGHGGETNGLRLMFLNPPKQVLDRVAGLQGQVEKTHVVSGVLECCCHVSEIQRIGIRILDCMLNEKNAHEFLPSGRRVRETFVVCQRRKGLRCSGKLTSKYLPFYTLDGREKMLSGGVMNIQCVGVVGAGVMGTGVAQTLAQTDHRVVLVDLTEEILRRAERDIRKNLRLQRLLKKGEKRVGPDDVLSRITFTLDVQMLEEADYVIENVVEKWNTKKDLYTRLDALCPDNCIFGSNTSAISITRIASVTNRAPQVIGIHFMNPAPLKNTVELIPGAHTSQQTIEVTKGLLSRMGQDFVVVKDAPGFVSNRVLMLTINEAISVVQDQVAEAKDVDRIFRACFDHKMGPLETADLIGLDTILLSLEVLWDSYQDSKYRPALLLRKMVDAGLLGRKSGEGFYRY